MTLTGILKNILLVIVSVMIWSTHITGLQILGYAIALVGLMYYSLGYDQMIKLGQNTKTWLSDVWSSPASDGKLPTRVRRFVVVLGTLLAGAALFLLFFADREVTGRKAVKDWLGTH